MSVRKPAATHPRKSHLSRKQTSMTALGKQENTRIFNSEKMPAHKSVNTPYPFPSLPFFEPSEGPITGPSDEAVTTPCQVIPFIVRKHPCKGTHPTFSTQVNKQQIRVLNRKFTTTPQAPPFYRPQYSQEVSNILTAPMKKQLAQGNLVTFKKTISFSAGVQISGVSNKLSLMGIREPCHQSHRSCSVSFSSLESRRFRSSWLQRRSAAATGRRENKRKGERGGEREKGKVSRVPGINWRLSTSWYT